MANPKYQIGQLVDFNPARASVPASIAAYKILRLMPRDRGALEQEYRIKSVGEQFERVAKESELSSRA